MGGEGVSGCCHTRQCNVGERVGRKYVSECMKEDLLRLHPIMPTVYVLQEDTVLRL